MSERIPQSRLDEMRHAATLYGAANCWTGTTGMLAGMVDELLKDRDLRLDPPKCEMCLLADGDHELKDGSWICDQCLAELGAECARQLAEIGAAFVEGMGDTEHA